MTPYTPPEPFRTDADGEEVYVFHQLRSEVERVRRETVEECAKKPNCTECAKWAKEQADNREWIAGVKSGRKIVDRMVEAVIGKTITKIKKPLPLPPESLFELWWAEYLPEATQARAFEAWSRVDAAPQPAQPSEPAQPEQGPST